MRSNENRIEKCKKNGRMEKETLDKELRERRKHGGKYGNGKGMEEGGKQRK